MSTLDKRLSCLKNKNIAILGLGIENLALVKLLLGKKIPCSLTICDIRPEKEMKPKMEEVDNFLYKDNNIDLNLNLGKGYDKGLEKYDIVMRSPGYPLFSPNLVRAVNRKRGDGDGKGLVISSPMKLFFDLCPTPNIIGVTGTKGKGTTASLIHHILQRAGKRSFLGGNIGVAPFDFITKVTDNDWVVLELSSFQLEDIHKSPAIAVMTNFYREHLSSADSNNPNHHRKLKDYREAKLNIFRWQKRKDKAVANKRLKSLLAKHKFPAKFLYFTKSELPSSLMGEHNKENIAAAEIVAEQIKIDKKTIKKAVENFKGLEHRLEEVAYKGGVRYFNDSFATTPEAATVALRSFASPIILLAGGADKGSDFSEMAKEIKSRVKYVIFFSGQGSVQLRKELRSQGFPSTKMKTVYNMKDAIQIAKAQRSFGDVVLLSPGCASFGVFNNYKERGELFKKYC
jgi:UDP-N-acetylmuramoylalanine--D-glutamate ligase